MPKIQEPETIQATGISYETLEHPAFGSIRVNRVQGQRYLHGSDFQHQNYVVLSIAPAVVERSLGRDCHFARRDFLRIAMTEAQWATFVSSFGMGGGVPCTIEYREGQSVPGFPAPERAAKFKKEVADDLNGLIDELTKLVQEVEANTSGLTKPKKEAILARATQALRYANDHVPFLNEQFAEHMEGEAEKAKAEVEGYLNQRLTVLGLSVARAPDFQTLEGPNDDQD
jgi:hypothetical protein